MGLEFNDAPGTTRLTEEEREGLLIKSISTRAELNELEQLNIQTATEWTLRRKFGKDDILSMQFINDLHKRMFNDVWRWAGMFRKSDKQIGVPWFNISTNLKTLVDDCKFWVDNAVYSEEEIAIRFKHRIVSIHCYPNGNGRHSRLMADVMISHIFNRRVFTWGSERVAKENDTRKKYLEALRLADRDNFKPLIEFARS